jgi:GT2 family glycosyltransferase
MTDAVTIVIPAHGLARRTADCLTRLRCQTPGSYFRVTVVDDASPDDTPELIPPLGRELFGPAFRFVRLAQNAGFATACNAGAAGSHSEYLLFLNNDTLVEKGWLPPLLAAFREERRLGACSPLLVFPETGRLQHAGVVFDPDLRALHLYFLFPGRHPVLAGRRRLQAISASAFLVQRGVFERLGGFFPGYKNGSEDLDLCAGIRAVGLDLTCVAQSRVVHDTSQTPGRFDHVEANTRLLNARQVGRFVPDLDRFARRDGFTLRLNDWLRPYLTVPDDRAAALGTACGDRGAAADAAVLEAEPLWEPGYVRAIRDREAAGDAATAAASARLRAHFFPSLESLGEAVRLSRASGEDAAAREVLADLETARQALARPEALAARARANLQLFRESGRAPLAELYRQWLASRGQPAVASGDAMVDPGVSA